MSGGLDVLSLKEDDVTKMLAATTHMGTDKKDIQMENYIYKRRTDGMCAMSYVFFNVMPSSLNKCILIGLKIKDLFTLYVCICINGFIFQHAYESYLLSLKMEWWYIPVCTNPTLIRVGKTLNL
jgi:hypothetical protein